MSPSRSHQKQPRGAFANQSRYALSADGKSLFVANRRSGSVSVIDTATRTVASESDVGRGLVDLAALPGGRYLLAIDQASNHLLSLDSHGPLIRVAGRLTLSTDPVKLVIAADGSFGAVSSRWSRRVTFVGLARPDSPDAAPALFDSGFGRTAILPVRAGTGCR